MMTSTSDTPPARAACITCSKIACGSTRIGAPYLDLAEARRACAVSGAHYLFGLSLAAVGHAPQRPVLAPGDGGARVPEFGGDTAVTRVLQHADAFAAANLPTDFAAELEVVPLVVNRPAPVGLHVDAVGIENLFEGLLAGLEADVGHADERNPCPAIGAHAAVGVRVAHDGRGLARGPVP